MPRDRLTQRQNEAYEFIRGFLERRRKPPTLHEIGDALGIASSNGVYKLLQALERKGYIEREKHTARGIRLVEDDRTAFGWGDDVPRLPVIGPASSNRPGEIRDRPRTTLAVDRRLLQSARDPDACLLGRAGDDGMNGAGIHKGDLLLVEEMDRADLRNGTLAAVLLRDQFVAREYHFANGRIHLRPADRHYSEDAYPPGTPEAYVVGRILSIIRRIA